MDALSPAAFGQTFAVVDKSGKVVSNSKHLFNVFKDARQAYRERKAQLLESRLSPEERNIRRHARVYTIDDDDRSSARSGHSARTDIPRRKPLTERRHSGDHGRGGGSIYSDSHGRFDRDLSTMDLRSPKSPASPTSPRGPPGSRLARRSTEQPPHFEYDFPSPRRTRSYSVDEETDMDLAYGELPPDLVVKRTGDERELNGLVGRVKFLLDEADCVQYSVTAIVAKLQKNPEAMAAVALTLAEISNIVSKMAPGAVMSLRSAAPAVFGLLASPQFLIAGGMAVGVTIVAFGGYKIIKKIQAKKALEKPDNLLEIGGDVSRIDSWRRGIAEIEERSVGTSVDGEFITPMAANMSKLRLDEERIRESRRAARDLRDVKVPSPSSRGGSRSGSGTGKGKEIKVSSRPTSSRRESSSRGSNSKNGESKRDKDKKKPGPSPLRSMFNSVLG